MWPKNDVDRVIAIIFICLALVMSVGLVAGAVSR